MANVSTTSLDSQRREKAFVTEASFKYSESLCWGKMALPPLFIDGADGDHSYCVNISAHKGLLSEPVGIMRVFLFCIQTQVRI